MKKTHKMLATVATLLLLNSSSYAEITINNNIYNQTDNSLNVSGKIYDTKANIPLGLIIKKDGNIVFADYVLANNKDSSGEIKYSFSPFVIETTADSGDFDIDVYSDITMENETIQFSYSGAGEKLIILKKIQDPLSVNDAIMTSGEKINIDTSMYSSISDKSGLIEKISGFDVNLPEDCDTVEECNVLQQALTAFIDRYVELCCNYALSEVMNDTDYGSWADKYYDLLEMGTSFKSYYDKAVSKSTFIDRIKLFEARDTLNDVKQAIFDCVFLETVRYGNYQDIMSIVSGFPQYINIDTEMSGLNSVQVSKKYEIVAGTNYTNIPAFKTALANAPTGSVGGGAGGGKDKTGNIANVSINTGITTPQTSNQIKKEMHFTDIENVPWAIDAITDCYKRGIISGRTDEVFAPQENVTRAEFIKMLVTAVNKNVNAEIPFQDVKDDDWYYKYVKNAYALGLIHGNNNNCFMPDENITRQDMAVMIYRAIQRASEGDIIDFEDKEQISDYALDAVGYLYQNNFISGMGNNTFAPLNNTTRAEAVSIIYRVFLK